MRWSGGDISRRPSSESRGRIGRIEKFRARARASAEKRDGFDEAVFAKLSERLRYISCDYGAPATHAAIRIQQDLDWEEALLSRHES